MIGSEELIWSAHKPSVREDLAAPRRATPAAEAG
ncbi:hypothetical protein hbim_04699 [Mycolicibacterium mageritense]|uniref:Uncharacterized protein n=1 Tax=Mycolicibacterium mageritense TaxID=53462 RepID=A0AAI8TTQ0_MYCME|nr:hypothetical protein hbim_04699 [Mycolicibacterium mageritense]